MNTYANYILDQKYFFQLRKYVALYEMSVSGYSGYTEWQN